MAGVVLGRYELGELLGSGGMADVYAARDRLLDRGVAIKFFRGLDKHADRARFVGEARMLAGLSHPGLVTVFDASFEDHRRPCLIMRLVDGGTLRRRIDADGPLESEDVALLGARLATALAHVHANGIVHRDVKPSNVLIDTAGDYYLADFGLAWTMGSGRLTKSGELVGTPSYLAPEQVTGTTVGPAADIYAFGLVLLECLTGRTEYDGTDIESALARLSRPPIVPEQYGPAWRQLLTAMTDTHPHNRPDAGECARRLQAIAETAPATPHDDTARADHAPSVPGTAPALSATAPWITTPIERRKPSPAATTWGRVGKLRASLGAAGAAGLVLAAVLCTPTTSTAGEPVPDNAHGSTIAPTDGAQQKRTPVTTAGAPAATVAHPPQPRQAAKAPATTSPAPPSARAEKPKNDPKTKGKPAAEPRATKPHKPK